MTTCWIWTFVVRPTQRRPRAAWRLLAWVFLCLCLTLCVVIIQVMHSDLYGLKALTPAFSSRQHVHVRESTPFSSGRPAKTSMHRAVLKSGLSLQTLSRTDLTANSSRRKGAANGGVALSKPITLDKLALISDRSSHSDYIIVHTDKIPNGADTLPDRESNKHDTETSLQTTSTNHKKIPTIPSLVDDYVQGEVATPLGRQQNAGSTVPVTPSGHRGWTHHDVGPTHPDTDGSDRYPDRRRNPTRTQAHSAVTERLSVDRNRLGAEPNLPTDSNVLDTDNDQLDTDNDQLDTDNDQLDTDNDHLDIDNDQLDTDNDQLDTDNDHLDTDNDHLDTDNDQLDTDNDHLDTDNDQLDTDNDYLYDTELTLPRRAPPLRIVRGRSEPRVRDPKVREEIRQCGHLLDEDSSKLGAAYPESWSAWNGEDTPSSSEDSDSTGQQREQRSLIDAAYRRGMTADMDDDFVGPRPLFPPCRRQEDGAEDGFYGSFKRPRYINGSRSPCWMVKGKDRGKQFYCLPYFFLVGVSKSATTALFNRLTLHPKVLTTRKEPHFFQKGRFKGNMGKMDCLLQYAYNYKKLASLVHLDSLRERHNDLIAGDATPGYFIDSSLWRCFPGNEGCSEPRVLIAHHILRLQPRAKVIIIFRDPASRLYSRYLYYCANHAMCKWFGPVSPTSFHRLATDAVAKYSRCLHSRSIRECAYSPALDRQVSPAIRLRESFYSVFLEDWLRIVPRRQLHVLLFDSFVHNTTREMHRLFTFLDLESLPEEVVEERLQESDENRGKYRAGDILPKTRALLTNFFHPVMQRLYFLLQKHNLIDTTIAKRLGKWVV